jgi:hypothetical protein
LYARWLFLPELTGPWWGSHKWGFRGSYSESLVSKTKKKLETFRVCLSRSRKREREKEKEEEKEGKEREGEGGRGRREEEREISGGGKFPNTNLIVSKCCQG